MRAVVVASGTRSSEVQGAKTENRGYDRRKAGHCTLGQSLTARALVVVLDRRGAKYILRVGRGRTPFSVKDNPLMRWFHPRFEIFVHGRLYGIRCMKVCYKKYLFEPYYNLTVQRFENDISCCNTLSLYNDRSPTLLRHTILVLITVKTNNNYAVFSD
jgi:hypothetical protein